MTLTDLLGLIAAALTTLSFVPQAIQSVRTRNLTGISLGMYSAFTLGVALWLVYGLVIDAMPVIIANAVTLPLCGTITVLKLLERRRRRNRGRFR
jgi:MtN3 and saliva related transmembrane protein